MKTMSGPQNADYLDFMDSHAIGFGAARPPFLLSASSAVPSKRCGRCEYTLVCASMAVHAYQCQQCRVVALWVEELNQWIWPTERDCAHKEVNTIEKCYSCQANEDALHKMRELSEHEPRTVTATGTATDATYAVDSATVTGAKTPWK